VKSIRTRSSRSGQAIIFVMMALVALIFVLMWNVDLHRIVSSKNRAQNAGDAAALTAARWQGATLNLVGELNIFHVLALAADDAAAVDAITNMQARLCYTGPMTAFYAAQLAAKNNRMPVNADFTAVVRDHAATVRTTYGQDTGDGPLFPEPFPGAWETYADLIDAVAADGIAAAPDNARFYNDVSGPHLLLDVAFYDAVNGRSWCWFWFNARSLLETYQSYTDWPPLPDAGDNPTNPDDCEFYGIGVHPVARPFVQVVNTDLFDGQLRESGRNPPADYADDKRFTERVEIWYRYDTARWQAWDALSDKGESPLPLFGTVREEYDYTGADAAVRVLADVSRMTPGLAGTTRSDRLLWSAAAKPFGYLEQDGDKVRPDTCGLVLPAFRAVRLIPMDGSSAPVGSHFDLEWRRHCDEHLPRYTQHGTASCVPGCWYCAQLLTWEDPIFRQTGVAWLELNHNLCTLPSGNGGGPGGGTRRGH